MKPNNFSGASVVENLESRTFLSAAGSPFTGFGSGGQLAGYAVLAARNDGSLIAENAQDKLVLLHPDGTFASNYSGPAPQTIPVQNVQSDGKYLIVKNGALTRYNKNGTIDKTFGTTGTVSNFYTYEPGATHATFQLQAVALDGTKIFVSGVELDDLDPDFAPSNGIFVERLTSSGKIDTTFGNRGIASQFGLHSPTYLNVFFLEIGPDHNLYVAEDYDEDPVVDRFSESGTFQGEAYQYGEADEEAVAGIAFQHNGKILIMTKDDDYSMTLARYNANMTPDTSFGDSGVVNTPYPNGYDGVDDNTPIALSLRADGAIIISAHMDADTPTSTTSTYFTFAYTSQATASEISGHFYDDANGNGKLDPGEAPLRYWAAFVDTNNDGVWEPGEPIAYADYNGYYKFYNLAPGTYIVREIPQAGWTRTSPAGNYPAGDYKVTLGIDQLVGLRDFGNRK